MNETLAEGENDLPGHNFRHLFRNKVDFRQREQNGDHPHTEVKEKYQPSDAQKKHVDIQYKAVEIVKLMNFFHIPFCRSAIPD